MSSITHTLSQNWQGQNGSTIPASNALTGVTETNSNPIVAANTAGYGVPFNWSHTTGQLLWILSDTNLLMTINAAAPYVFTCSSANATIGSTWTNNTQTFTVLATIAGGTVLLCTGTGAPSGSGTLTKATGTGDSTITFSAVATALLPINLIAGQPYVWHSQNYTSNPLSSDATELYFTNATGGIANVKIRSLHN